MNSLSLMYVINTNLNEYQLIVFWGVTPWLDMVIEPPLFLAYICNCNSLLPFFINLLCISIVYHIHLCAIISVYLMPDNVRNCWYTHQIPTPLPRDILWSRDGWLLLGGTYWGVLHCNLDPICLLLPHCD